jgi:hypothetical protein
VPLSSLHMADQLMVVAMRRVEGGVLTDDMRLPAYWKEDELKAALCDNRRLVSEAEVHTPLELYCLADGLAMPDRRSLDMFHPDAKADMNGSDMFIWVPLMGNITLARNAALAPQADAVILVHVLPPGACAVWPAWSRRLGERSLVQLS